MERKNSSLADAGADDKIEFPWQNNQVPGYGERLQRMVSKNFDESKKERIEEKKRQRTMFDYLCMILPCLSWISTYNVKEHLLWDLIAGLSVGAMVVPSGLSYAAIAGLPAVMGLYGAFVPCIVYCLFGNSRQLSVGPVAVTSLLIGNGMAEVLPEAKGISNPNQPTDAEMPLQLLYNQKVIQLAFLVAVLYTASGVLGLGVILTRFMSHPTISGFISGASVIICLSQFKLIMGVKMPRRQAIHEQLQDIIAAIPKAHWQEVVMGVSLMIMLVAFKQLRKAKWRPLHYVASLGPLTACVVGIAAVFIGNLDKSKTIITVGTIRPGLPPFTVNQWFPILNISPLIKLAIIVWIIDLLESTCIARELAMKNGYKLNVTQEIVGLGISNLSGAMTSCYSTTGSFSCSAVNNDSGAKTPLANMFCGILVGFVLLVLCPVFERIPMNVLGAIIIVGVAGLVEVGYAVHLFRTRLWDFAVFMVSFLAVMFLGIELGLIPAVAMPLITMMMEAAMPPTSILGQVENTTAYRNVKQYPDAKCTPGVLIFRLSAPLYFANLQWTEDKLREYEVRAKDYSEAHGQALRYVVWDTAPISYMDTQGVDLIEELAEYFSHKGIQLVLVDPSPKLARLWERSGLTQALGQQWVFARVHDAVAHCQGLLARAQQEEETLLASGQLTGIKLDAFKAVAAGQASK